MDEKEQWVKGLAGLKEKFIDLLSCVDRPGRDALIYYLSEKTDFFIAPASANGHNNYPGGLVEHSLTVYFRLRDIYPENVALDSTLIIVSLLHDVCKANFYKSDLRNKKVEGQRVQEPYVSIEDQLPLGHGEKSVIVIQLFMQLTLPEIMAIRWHMAGFDDISRSYAGGLALSKAMQKFPLITYLHCADLISCLQEEIK